MAFVREVISKEDFEKYQIGRYEERIANSLLPESAYWAIDRERGSYLVSVSYGPRELDELDLHNYIFFVNGNAFIISLSINLSKLGEKHWLRECKQKFWNFVPDFSTEQQTNSMAYVKKLFKEAMVVYRRPGQDNDSKLDFAFDF